MKEILVRAYALAILAGHVVVFLFFINTTALFGLLKRTEPLCWPYLENCGRFRFESLAGLEIVLMAYLALLVAAALVARHNFKACLTLILVLDLFLLGIISLDYRLRANEFYMLLWLNFVFLLWPHRRWAVPLILISFYFWAGRLKLNYEWLSGSVLYQPLWLIPEHFTSIACVYVVVLEMVLIWGLLSKRRWIRWTILLQLALFHVQSLSQIHWFYPALMVTMLAWFVIEDVMGTSDQRPSLSMLFRGQAPKSAYALLFIFALFQLAPLLYRGDSTLTGQGRIFALHMFEARQVCEVSATVHYAASPSQTIDLKLVQLPPRMICDPVIYYSRVENICSSRARTGIVNLDFLMKAKRTTDAGFQTIIDEPRFCDPAHYYSIFRNTPWLH